jgi:hypothetical protein
MPGSDELRAMVTGFRLSAALSVAAELGLSDQLASGPRRIDDLATAVSADPATLQRLVRALASVGVYAEQPDGAFANTLLGEGLRSDVPGSMRPLARTLQDPAVWAAWGHLAHSVRTGETAFEALHGIDVWTHRQGLPEQNAIFNDNMSALSSLVAGAVAASYDFSGVPSVVDIGGGSGVLLEAVLSRYPHLTGTVFDQPHVVADAPTPHATESVATRWSAESGSFFEAVPAADAYLLKSILHDWQDDRCVEILRTCRRSLNDEGVVLVVETILGRPGHEVDAAFTDLTMLVGPGGRERTEQEYAALFEAADLRLTDVVHTNTRVSVLEARAQEGR